MWNRLEGGKEEGVDIVTIENGRLRIVVVPTRGMGIHSVTSSKGIGSERPRLGWNSPVEEIVHPKFINLYARGGLGWLDGFNEWLCRCGLENVGQPGPDTIITNTGDKATIDLPLHGRIANIPASWVSLRVEKTKPFRITLSGVVKESMVFGPNFELLTEVSTVPGSDTFTIRDVVTNRAGTAQEFQLLYHFNFGAPILGKGAKLKAPLEKVTPFNDRAAKDVDAFDQFLGPTAGYVEQVYLMRPIADKEGTVPVLLHNEKENLGCSLRYGAKALPFLTLWKNTGAAADGYVVGIEPGTSYPNRRAVERKAGRVPKLEAGGKHETFIEVRLLEGEKAVRGVREDIEGIQGKREVTVDKAPMP
jgi:hypothetical protein